VALEYLAVFTKAVIFDMKQPVLYPPMATHQVQQPFGSGLLSAQAGYPVVAALSHFPGLQPNHLLPHFHHLLEARETAIPFQFSGGPYFPSLQPAMSFLSQHQFRLATLGKEGLYILVEGWLVFFSFTI
jgi:hypothetical protein